MKTWGKWIIGALMMALVLGVSSVNAQDSDDDFVHPRVQMAEIVIGAVAEATGLSEDEILEQVQDGNSLLEILEAEGVDSETVIASITEQLTAEIEQALADGEITELRAEYLLERLPTMIDHLLNFGHFDHPVMGRMMAGFGMHMGEMGMRLEWDGFFGMRGEHRGFFGMHSDEHRGMFGRMGRGSHR